MALSFDQEKQDKQTIKKNCIILTSLAGRLSHFGFKNCHLWL